MDALNFTSPFWNCRRRHFRRIYSHSAHWIGYVLGSLTYGMAAGTSYVLEAWWPLFAGFVLACGFRLVGFTTEPPISLTRNPRVRLLLREQAISIYCVVIVSSDGPVRVSRSPFRSSASTMLNHSNLWNPGAIQRQLAQVDSDRFGEAMPVLRTKNWVPYNDSRITDKLRFNAGSAACQLATAGAVKYNCNSRQ
jgi:hypothetical protein